MGRREFRAASRQSWQVTGTPTVSADRLAARGLATRQNYPFCAVTSINALGPESAHNGGLRSYRRPLLRHVW
jgi:hypothetical protein